MLFKSLSPSEKNELAISIGSTKQNLQHYVKPRKVPRSERLKRIISWFQKNKGVKPETVLSHFYATPNKNQMEKG